MKENEITSLNIELNRFHSNQAEILEEMREKIFEVVPAEIKLE